MGDKARDLPPNEESDDGYELHLDGIRKQLRRCKRKNKALYRRLTNKLEDIQQNAEIGEPKSYQVKGTRAVKIGPFVLLYKVEGRKVIALDFDHHDKIYRGAGT